jgi:Fanconi anemia group M protein
MELKQQGGGDTETALEATSAPLDGIDIFVDDRERDSGIAHLLRTRFQMTVIEKRLAWADYEIFNRIFVERKTVDDFARSIVDGRLFRQIAHMRERTENALLVLEGDLSKPLAIDLHLHAMRGALLSVTLDWDVPLMFSTDIQDTALILWLIYNRHRTLQRDVLMRPGRKPKRLKNRQSYMLQGLPGVGPAIARQLLERFGSVAQVMQATAQELVAIDGIGNTKAQKIREVIEATTCSGEYQRR